MTVQFKKDTPVRQIVKPIEGVIDRFSFDPAEGKISYIVRWTDAEGDHERSFSADELEAVPEVPTA